MTSFKDFFIIIFLIYVVTLVLGFTIPSIGLIKPVTHDTVQIASLQPPIDLFISVLLNNLIASLLIIMVGFIGFIELPTILVMVNAFYIGQFINIFNKSDTIMAIYAMFPHAIIEIPIIILCGVIGSMAAQEVQKSVGSNKITDILKKEFNIKPIIINFGIKPYIFYIIPLIIIAAFIESHISLYILKAIFNPVCL